MAIHDSSPMQEGLLERREYVDISVDDQELVQTLNTWIEEAKPLHEEMKRIQDRNERYYLGKQLDEDSLGEYSAKIVLNKIYQTLETIVPRATDNLPAPMVTLPPSDDEGEDLDNSEYANNLEEIIFAIAQEASLIHKFGDWVRNQQLYRLGVFKFGFDDGQIWIENIRPQRIMIPPYPYLDYVIEYHESTLKEIIERFPEKEEEIRDSYLQERQRKKKSKKDLGSRLSYYEITTPEFKVFKMWNIILKKTENPHWSQSGKNHWKKPRIDYVFSDLYTMGKNRYSQTTTIDQILPLQDAINARERQIHDLANLSNGVLIGYGESGISKKEMAAVEIARRRPNGAVYVKGAQGSVSNFPGQQPHPTLFDDLRHLINEVDNIAGTHGTLRGEKGSNEETFGGRQLLKEADLERIGILVKMVERASEEIYNAFAQLIIRHFKGEHYLTYLGKDGRDKQVAISKDMIRDGARIKVNQGTTLIKDKASMAQEAIVLWQMGAPIDSVTLLERLGFANPDKVVKRWYLEKTRPEEYHREVEERYEQATKSQTEKDIMAAATRADFENRELRQGVSVPPYRAESMAEQNAHLAAHQAELPSLQGADLKVIEAFERHIKEEGKHLLELTGAMEEEERKRKEVAKRFDRSNAPVVK